jgi:hypothetical protein
VARKVLGVVAVAAGAMLALTGCGKPAGTDGNLTNGWAMMPAAKIIVPTAPACYQTSEDDLTAVTKWPDPISCTTAHNVELIATGQFGGAGGSGANPPASGSPDRATAYADCATKAKTYLGDDWRTGRLDLTLDVPSAQQWDAGARWYRCDVQEYKDLQDYTVVSRSTSVKDGLAPNGPLRLGCMSITQAPGSADIDTILPIACSATHNGEFAGVWDAPAGDYPADADARKNANLQGCRAVVGTYANIPNDANFTYRTGQVATPFNKASWELGNRGVRCYIWLNKNVTTSLKGAGQNGLPINYG